MDDEQRLAGRLADVTVEEVASPPSSGPPSASASAPAQPSPASRSQSLNTASSAEVFAPDVFSRRRARPQPAAAADAPLDALRVRPSAPVLVPRLSRGQSQEDEKDSLAPTSSLGTAPSVRAASPLKQPRRLSAEAGERELRPAPIVDFSQLSGGAPAAPSAEKESKGKDTVRSLPSTAALGEASRAVVYKENGAGIKFGELFASRKTLVIFTSDWNDQALEPYLKTLCNVNMASLGKIGVSLILLGQGSVGEMTALQEMVPVPFSLYTDVDRSVYRALGMDHLLDGGARKRSKASLRKNLLHIAPQKHVLGGEFLLGPGLRCGFAHRLTGRDDHTDVARLLHMVGVSNPMLPLRQQIDPVDRARAQLETVDYWSAEKPYYSNAQPKPAKGRMGNKKVSHPNLLQESKSRLSLFWKKQPPSKPLEALPNYTEGLHNPDPFAAEQPEEQPSSWRGERPLRTQASSSTVAPEEGFGPAPGEVLPPPRPGKPGKISVRQLTTAALQPMSEP